MDIRSAIAGDTGKGAGATLFGRKRQDLLIGIQGEGAHERRHEFLERRMREGGLVEGDLALRTWFDDHAARLRAKHTFAVETVSFVPSGTVWIVSVFGTADGGVEGAGAGLAASHTGGSGADGTVRRLTARRQHARNQSRLLRKGSRSSSCRLEWATAWRRAMGSDREIPTVVATVEFALLGDRSTFEDTEFLGDGELIWFMKEMVVTQITADLPCASVEEAQKY